MLDLLHSPDTDDTWYRRGLCREEDDPDLFYPVGSPGSPAYDKQVEVAQGICELCPVKNECLLWAVESVQEHGVWGGTEENERVARIRVARSAGTLATPRLATNAQVSEIITDAIERETANLRRLADKDAEARRRNSKAA